MALACPRLTAQPAWQCIDIISDLHLDAQHPRTQLALFDYLAATPASALLVLGDLFEAWVGDDMRHQHFERECTQALADAGKRLWLGFMGGNRDFLVGPDMLAACHAHALPDPLVLEAFGQAHLLTHGDAWCLADLPYLTMRRQLRDPAWQSAFLARPFSDRLAVARGMREASEARKMNTQGELWADVDATHAAQWLAATGSLSLIHGHTHRPGSQPFALPGATRHVLSDWDLDGELPRAEVFRLSPAGIARLSLSEAVAPSGSPNGPSSFC